MTLDAVAKRLAEISGEPIRNYSTCDFGRERNPDARSVVVSREKAHQIRHRIRSEIGPDFVAFIGTTNWLGDEKNEGAVEVVVANGKSQFDIIRVAQSDAVNFDMDTEELITKLGQYDRAYGINIFHAETDTIEFSFTKLPDDMPGFCKDLYEFCPDIVDQGFGSVEALEIAIRKTREVYLWWD